MTLLRLDVAIYALGLDLLQVEQVLLQARRALHPEGEPAVQRLFVLAGLRVELGRIGGSVDLGSRIRVGRAVAGQLGTVLRPAPEAAPLALGALVGAGGVVNRNQITEPGSDVGMCCGSEFLKFLFELGVLTQCLDEGAERVQDHRVRTLDHLRELARFEARIDPLAVVVEIKVRNADQEIARPEAIKRFKPAPARLQLALERIDIRTLRGHDSPPEYTDAPSTQHGSIF